MDLQLDVLVLLLELLDDVKVLLRDVVIVLFHLAEGVLMIDHQIVDVLVLALLNLVQLDLHTQLKFFLQGHLFLFIH